MVTARLIFFGKAREVANKSEIIIVLPQYIKCDQLWALILEVITYAIKSSFVILRHDCMFNDHDKNIFFYFVLYICMRKALIDNFLCYSEMQYDMKQKF